MAAQLVKEPLKAAQSAISNSKENGKVKDLKRDFRDMDKSDRMTNDFGVRQGNTDHWLTVTNRDHTGAMLLEDHFGREKIHRFDHERIPERVVHARGAGAFGEFKLYESAEDVTFAPVLTDTSRTTPVFLRFSTVLGSRGSADTVRDVRGFAVKFYTQEGNWDIVGNDIPVFFIQDAIKFPDLIHSGKPEPHNEVPQAQTAHNNFWDFMYLHKEATHMYFWAMSDRGIPRSYRMVQGFGVNTFTLINAKGERNFVKFHFTPELGVHSLVWDEALKLAGQDPDFHRKDLWEAIDNGAFPVWKFGIQVIPEAKEHDFDFDILDATKVWPEDLVPVRYIGEMTLNRNVDEYFTETEQVAFCTSHVVPGIGFSDDPLLQGRNFSYLDTQLSRLGINFQELPINRPVCPVMNVNRDGAMRHTISRGTVNYYPNRFDVIKPASTAEGAYVDYAQKLAGVKARAKSDKFKEYVAQAQLFYNSMSEVEKTHIVNALAFELDHVDEPLVYSRIAERLAEIDIDLARTVAEKVGADPPKQTTNTNKGHRAPGLSQFDFIPKNPTIVSRRVAILISDGFDSTAFTAMKTAVASAMAVPMVIGIKRGMIPPASGSPVKPDHHFEGFRSTMVDALFIPGGKGSAATLRTNGRAVHWIREAFGHLKAIGATGEGVQVVRDVLGVHQLKTSSATDVVESYGVVTLETLEANSISEAWEAAKSGKGFVDQFFTAISQHRCWARETDGLNSLVAY